MYLFCVSELIQCDGALFVCLCFSGFSLEAAGFYNYKTLQELVIRGAMGVNIPHTDKRRTRTEMLMTYVPRQTKNSPLLGLVAGI